MSTREYKIIAVEGIDGSGKTTLIRKLDQYLTHHYNLKVLCEKLAPQMVEVYKELVDKPTGKIGEYQNVIPGDFRFASYIFESSVQMRIKDSEYRGYDVVLFDRWIQTNMAYLPEINWHREYFKMVLDTIPKPQIIFYLDVDTEVAMERLSSRTDWMVSSFEKDFLCNRLNIYKNRFMKAFEGFNVKTINSNGDEEKNFDLVQQELVKILAL